MDIHQICRIVSRFCKMLRPFPELITRRIIFIPKAFWRSPVPPSLFYRVVDFGHGNLVVHLNFRVSELDISSYSRQFSELITRPIIFIPTAFWRSWAPPDLFYRVLHLGLGNPSVHLNLQHKTAGSGTIKRIKTIRNSPNDKNRVDLEKSPGRWLDGRNTI